MMSEDNKDATVAEEQINEGLIIQDPEEDEEDEEEEEEEIDGVSKKKKKKKVFVSCQSSLFAFNLVIFD